MHTLNNEVIMYSGTNLNNVNFSKKCLKRCVEEMNSNITVPLTINFMKNSIIGFIKNFKYKNGKILADIVLTNDANITHYKVIRCLFKTIEIDDSNPIEITKCQIIEGSIIDIVNDAERELRNK